MSEYAVRTGTATITVRDDQALAVGGVALTLSSYKFDESGGTHSHITVRMTRRDAEALRDNIENVCDALAEQAAEAAMAR